MRCAHNPPPCRIFISWNLILGSYDDKISWKKCNLSPHFFMIFEYFGCLGARPGGLGHILSPRLGFLWFLRFAPPEILPPFGSKNDQKSFKNRSQTQQVFRSLFWSTLEPSWDRFGRIWGPKMEPKLVQNRSQERSWSKCKYLQIHRQGRCFWGSEVLGIDQKSLLRRC